MHDELVTLGGESAAALKPVLVILFTDGGTNSLFELIWDQFRCSVRGLSCDLCCALSCGLTDWVGMSIVDPNFPSIAAVIVTVGLRHAPNLPLPAAGAHNDPKNHNQHKAMQKFAGCRLG
jgi:hypothetical protein